MSESEPRDGTAHRVVDVLRVLRAEARQLDAVRVGDVSLVKQISDRAAEILGMDKLQPTVEPVVASLHQHAARVSRRVRFTDVGTVQQIGDGVAKLSGLPSARTEELVTFPTGVRGMVLNLEHGGIENARCNGHEPYAVFRKLTGDG